MRYLIISILTLLISCNQHASIPFAVDNNQIPVVVISVVGPDSLNFSDLTTAFSWTEKAFEPTPWRVQFAMYYETTVQAIGDPNFQDWDARFERMSLCRKWLLKNKLTDSKKLYYFFWPPLIIEGRKAFGGMAARDEAGGVSLAIGNGSAFSSPFKEGVRDRIYASGGIVAAHELGHLIGMNHYDSEPNIMASDAGRYSDTWRGSLPFLQTSISEALNYFGTQKKFKRCMRKHRRKVCLRKVFLRKQDTGDKFGF